MVSTHERGCDCDTCEYAGVRAIMDVATKGRKPRPVMQPTDGILTPEQVAERLQVSPSWVYEQTRDRAHVRNHDPLPYRKMGRYLRFRWDEVKQWLDRQKGGNNR